MTIYECQKNQEYRISYVTHKGRGLPMLLFSRVEDGKDVDEFAFILTSSVQAGVISRLCDEAKMTLEKMEGGQITWPKNLQ